MSDMVLWLVAGVTAGLCVGAGILLLVTIVATILGYK